MDRRRPDVLLRDPEVRTDGGTFALLRALSDRGGWLTADELVEAMPADSGVDGENVVSLLWGLWIRTLVETRTRTPGTETYRITELGSRTVERVETRSADE